MGKTRVTAESTYFLPHIFLNKTFTYIIHPESSAPVNMLQHKDETVPLHYRNTISWNISEDQRKMTSDFFHCSTI